MDDRGEPSGEEQDPGDDRKRAPAAPSRAATGPEAMRVGLGRVGDLLVSGSALAGGDGFAGRGCTASRRRKSAAEPNPGGAPSGSSTGGSTFTRPGEDHERR